MTTTRGTPYIGEVMSNFDRLIDRDIDAKLVQNAGNSHADYPAMNFYALVYFDGDKFVAEVYRYSAFQGIFREDTTDALMHTLSNMYGWD